MYRYRELFATVSPSDVLSGVKHDPIVYFVGIGTSVKIGTSTNMRVRLTSFALFPENIIVLIRGGSDVEHAFHERFNEQHIRGEWFKFSGQLRSFLTYINQVKEREEFARNPDEEIYPFIMNVIKQNERDRAIRTRSENVANKIDDGKTLFTLREMCEAGIVPIRYSAAKRARTRAGEAFPEGKPTPIGTAYEPGSVREFFANRSQN